MNRTVSSFSPGGSVSASMSVTKPHLYSRLANVSISRVSVGMSDPGRIQNKAERDRRLRLSRLDQHEELPYALKLDPQPQLLVALGFLNTKPLPMTSSRKSISVPLRYRWLFMSITTLTPLDS